MTFTINQQKLESKSIHRLRLTVEELLINLMGHAGTGTVIKIEIGKRFGRHVFLLKYRMEPFDPIKSTEESWVEKLMRSLGFYPSWSHRGTRNTVSLVLKDRPRRGTLFRLLVTVVAAFALGGIGGLLPESLRETLTEGLLSPASNAFLGLLNTFSGIMIVLTIWSGIIGMEDSMSVGRLGKSAVVRFVLFSLVISVLSVAIILPFLQISISDATLDQSSPVVQITQMLFENLPSNLIDPFRMGNAIQLLVIAIFLGFSSTAIGESGRCIRDLVIDSATLLQHTVSVICGLIPFFVFFTLVEQLWSGMAQQLLINIKPILMIFGTGVMVMLALLILTSLRLKCSPLLLLKKLLSPFLIAFTTASSISAMPLGMQTCEQDLGVSRNMVSFLYPLGSVIYMPSTVVFFSVVNCAFAELYGVQVDLPWLITACLTSALLAIALPPIPGADILCFSVMFASLGIPSSALILVSVIDVAYDFFDTGFNVFALILQITSEAERAGLLDHRTLLHETSAKDKIDY